MSNKAQEPVQVEVQLSEAEAEAEAPRIARLVLLQLRIAPRVLLHSELVLPARLILGRLAQQVVLQILLALVVLLLRPVLLIDYPGVPAAVRDRVTALTH